MPGEIEDPADQANGTSPRWTGRSRRTRAGSSRCRHTIGGSTRANPETPRACTAPRSGPRRLTRCAACCRPPPAPTSGFTAPARRMKQLLLRMRAQPLAESREVADLMLGELRKVIPAFVQRVDRADRGVAWSRYLEERNRKSRAVAAGLDPRLEWQSYLDQDGPGADAGNAEVELTEFDPDGEARVVAALLYPGSGLSHDRLLAAARAMPGAKRVEIIRAGVGARANRRQRPGRAFEQTCYTFDVLSDYRCVPRPAAPPDADNRVAGSHDAPRLGGAGSGRRGRGCHGGLGAGNGSVDRAMRAAGAALFGSRGAVRRLHGVPHPLPDADECPRGDARDRAPHLAPGTPGLPARLPQDART